MRINLFISLYHINDTDRKMEIDSCLQHNLKIKQFDKIICFDEGFDWNTIDKNLVEIIEVNHRPTFASIEKYFKQDEINVISNNDIMFNSTIKKLERFFFSKATFVALTRIESDGTLFRKEKEDSQDVWAYFGNNNILKNCDFHLGLLGCDSRVIYEAWTKNYIIVNPSKSIQCMHIHDCNIRSYTQESRVAGPYLFIRPTTVVESLCKILLYKLIMKFIKINIMPMYKIKTF